MRKRLISICMIVTLVFSIYGCAKTAEDFLATETENVGSQDTEAENEEASDEGDEDKTIVVEEHDQGKDETDLMLDTTERGMFTYIIDDDSAVITGLQARYENSWRNNMPAYKRKIEIPDTLGGYTVVEIGDNAFEDIKLYSVYIPESVEIIGNSAFRNTDIVDVNISQCYNFERGEG